MDKGCARRVGRRAVRERDTIGRVRDKQGANQAGRGDATGGDGAVGRGDEWDTMMWALFCVCIMGLSEAGGRGGTCAACAVRRMCVAASSEERGESHACIRRERESTMRSLLQHSRSRTRNEKTAIFVNRFFVEIACEKSHCFSHLSQRSSGSSSS